MKQDKDVDRAKERAKAEDRTHSEKTEVSRQLLAELILGGLPTSKAIWPHPSPNRSGMRSACFPTQVIDGHSDLHEDAKQQWSSRAARKNQYNEEQLRELEVSRR